MKEVKKIIAALIVVVLSLGIGHFTGLSLGEFIGDMEFNVLSLLKVLAVVGMLMALKSLLKLCLGTIRKESTLLTILRSLLVFADPWGGYQWDHCRTRNLRPCRRYVRNGPDQ